MSGKIICLIFAIYLAQGLAAPKKAAPLSVIDDIIAEVNKLVEQAKEALQKLIDLVEANGAEILKKAKELIDNVVQKAEDIVSKAGPCGEEAAPKIDQLKNDAEAAVQKCVVAELPDALKVVSELKSLVTEVEALTDDIRTKAEACLADGAGPVEGAECLAQLAAEEAPKVKDEADKLIPAVEDAVAAVDKLNDCIEPQVATLQQEVNQIVQDVEKCLAGN